jgi:hypothetical protein
MRLYCLDANIQDKVILDNICKLTDEIETLSPGEGAYVLRNYMHGEAIILQHIKIIYLSLRTKHVLLIRSNMLDMKWLA